MPRPSSSTTPSTRTFMTFSPGTLLLMLGLAATCVARFALDERTTPTSKLAWITICLMGTLLAFIAGFVVALVCGRSGRAFNITTSAVLAACIGLLWYFHFFPTGAGR